MKVEAKGQPSFTHLHIELGVNEGIMAEAGAMVSMSSGIDLRSRLNGGFFSAIIMKFLGKETLFKNLYFNTSTNNQSLVLSQTTPGQLIEENLNNNTIFIQSGAFLACTSGITMNVTWAGFSSWIAGEGLFRLRLSGTGKLWYGAFGGVIEKEVQGEYLIDSGHLLSYPPEMKLSTKLSGGIFSSFFGGEGFVLRLQGHGKIRLQTRSLSGLSQWLNSKFWG